jgi:uncharacterized protein with von Willebrand factor type A (vWA) domain
VIDERLVEFAGFLRQNGLWVSPLEVADAASALSLLGLERRELVKGALAATLVKRGRDVPVFDRLFDLYFGGLAKLLADLEQSVLDELKQSGLLDRDSLEMLAHDLQNRPLSPLTRAALGGDLATLSRLLRGAALQVNLGQMQSTLQQGFYVRRLGAAAGLSELQRELGQIEADLRARGLDPAVLQVVSTRLAKVLRGLERAVERLVQAEVEARLSKERRRADALANRNFSLLSEDEIGRVQDAVRRLAQKLKARLTKRERSRRRGALHVRHTLRLNMVHGGVPMRLAFRRKRAQRPDLILLCDVSDSVRAVSKLTLLFCYTLQSLYARVRSFAFVSDLGELTPHFRGRSAEEAIEEALSGQSLSLYANSNYGRALALFNRDFLGAVTRRTTVIVLGDGRNNYNPPNAWALRDIKLRAKRVLWLCPEARSSWGLGDSEMMTYERECTQVAVVQNLGDFEELAANFTP